MNTKIKKLILLLSLSFINIGCGFHIYKPELVKHQNIQAASLLKIGMKADETKLIMGQPIRVDIIGDTVVRQYCDTQDDKSSFVALFFKGESSLENDLKQGFQPVIANNSSLEKINYYSIFWQETKGIYYDGIDLQTLNQQISCEYTAQKNGEKNPDNITIALADGSTHSTKEIKELQKKVMFDRFAAALNGNNRAQYYRPMPSTSSSYNPNEAARKSFEQQWQMRTVINPRGYR